MKLKLLSLIKRGQLVTNCSDKKGFSLAEVVITTALFSLYITSLLTALFYFNNWEPYLGNKTRAIFLAEEGIEATRNIRDNNFNNLIDGIYGLDKTAGYWNLVSFEEIIDNFYRQIEISSVNSQIKKIISRVNWPEGKNRNGLVDLTTYLTNWQRIVQTGLVCDWSSITYSGLIDWNGSANGLKLQANGNYIYMVRDDANPDFAIIDVTDSNNPIITSSLALPGAPTNIAILGNYAYVSSSANANELVIVDISNPTTASIVGSYNAPGNANGLGIYVNAGYAYLVRANSADREFEIIDINNPALPISVGSLNLSAGANEVYVSGAYAYVAASHNSQELQIINISNPLSPNLAATINLPGSHNALSIIGFNNFVIVGENAGDVHLVDVTNSLTPSIIATVEAGGAVNDLALDGDNKKLFIASDYTSGELQVFNIETPSSPGLIGLYDASSPINGVAVSANQCAIYTASEANNNEFVILIKEIISNPTP